MSCLCLGKGSLTYSAFSVMNYYAFEWDCGQLKKIGWPSCVGNGIAKGGGHAPPPPPPRPFIREFLKKRGRGSHQSVHTIYVYGLPHEVMILIKLKKLLLICFQNLPIVVGGHHTYTVKLSMDGPHTPISVNLKVIFLAPHTHVLCMVSGSATGFFFPAVRLVHSLLKYFFTFQLWYWIQVYTTKYSILILIFRFLFGLLVAQHTEKEKFWSKSDMSTVIFSLLHEIHNGVGVGDTITQGLVASLLRLLYLPPPPL